MCFPWIRLSNVILRFYTLWSLVHQLRNVKHFKVYAITYRPNWISVCIWSALYQLKKRSNLHDCNFGINICNKSRRHFEGKMNYNPQILLQFSLIFISWTLRFFGYDLNVLITSRISFLHNGQKPPPRFHWWIAQS